MCVCVCIYIDMCVYVCIYIYIYNLKLSRRLNSIKSARSSGSVKWLNGDSPKLSGTISVLVTRELTHLPGYWDTNRLRNFVTRYSTTRHGWYPKNIILNKIALFQIQVNNLIFWGTFLGNELILVYEIWVHLHAKNEFYCRHTSRIKFPGRNISKTLKH